MTDVERDCWDRHAERVARRVRDGWVVLAGPTLGRTNIGLLVFEAPDEIAAWDLVNSDPTVSEGHVTRELMPCRVSFLRGRD
jgi:uncharacterized protein YciI